MSEDIFVGIDFGTTNSSIAWFNPETGRAEALYNAEGEQKTPSVVCVGSKEIIVGKLAEEHVLDPASHPRIIRAVKRELATGRVWYIDGRKWTSTEIAAEIIKKLKRDVEETYFRRPVERAVFTHPATFDEVEKAKLREAAELAGFREVALLEEPVAAVVAYVKEGYQVGDAILVYDLGGGTFDITFLMRSGKDKPFRLATRPSGLRVGGEDFDRLLYEEVDRLIRKNTGREGSSDILDLELLARCRRYKENLSLSISPPPLSWFPRNAQKALSIEIKSERFEALIRPYVDRTVKLAKQVFSEAACAKPDAVILIGGSSRIPLVRKRLEEDLGTSPLLWNKADVAVALGAAYHAAQLWGETVLDPKASSSLTEAINRAPVHGKIFLREGVYRLDRPLEITRPVELLGEGMEKTFVACEKEEYVLKVWGKSFTAKGITFEHRGSKASHVAVIASACIRIEACRFCGAVFDQSSETGGVGLYVRGTATGTVRDCIFCNNQLYGICLSGEANLVLLSNACERNSVAGIMYTESAGGVARNNVCRNNNHIGIAVLSNGKPRIVGNTCEHNGKAGILYFNAGGVAINNVCRNNEDAGIFVSGQATPILQANTCEGNKRYQIVKGKEAHPQLLSNLVEVTDNPGCLIVIVVTLTALGAGILILV